MNSNGQEQRNSVKQVAALFIKKTSMRLNWCCESAVRQSLHYLGWEELVQLSKHSDVTKVGFVGLWLDSTCLFFSGYCFDWNRFLCFGLLVFVELNGITGYARSVWFLRLTSTQQGRWIIGSDLSCGTSTLDGHECSTKDVSVSLFACTCLTSLARWWTVASHTAYS